MGADGPLFIYSVSFTVFEDRIINWTGLVQELEIVYLMWEEVGSLRSIFFLLELVYLWQCVGVQKNITSGNKNRLQSHSLMFFKI